MQDTRDTRLERTPDARGVIPTLRAAIRAADPLTLMVEASALTAFAALVSVLLTFG